jgi:lysophospholipase
MTMDLQVEEGHFSGYDGSELFFQTWSKRSPEAVILGVHGFGEHSDAYKLLAEGLKETPYQLIMSDLRGHGRSSGKRGLGTIDEFVLDIKLFYEQVRSRFPKLPLFILGHSLGGLIVMKFLIRNGRMDASGAVLSSPLTKLALEIPPINK